jgi:hypothetical protein
VKHEAHVRKSFVLWGGLLFGAFVISLALYAVFPPARARRVLFFPGAATSRLSGEVRYLRDTPNRETDIEELLEEYLLGPVNVHFLRVLPKATEIRALLYRGGVLYLDFNSAILFEEPEVPLDTGSIVEAVKKTLSFNFPYIQDIVVTVDGQLPRTPHFASVPAES